MILFESWHGTGHDMVSLKYITACLVRHDMGCAVLCCAVLCCIAAWHDRAGCMGEQDMVWCVWWGCFQCGILWLKSHRCERRSISIKLLTFNKSLNSQETSFSICKRKITKIFKLHACVCVCVCVCVYVRTHSVVPGSATAWTVARQAPLPMGFSRQECED